MQFFLALAKGVDVGEPAEFGAQVIFEPAAQLKSFAGQIVAVGPVGEKQGHPIRIQMIISESHRLKDVGLMPSGFGTDPVAPAVDLQRLESVISERAD